jgi:hypothetical protein
MIRPSGLSFYHTSRGNGKRTLHDGGEQSRNLATDAQKEWRESFPKHDKEIQIYGTLEKVRLMCCARV